MTTPAITLDELRRLVRQLPDPSAPPAIPDGRRIGDLTEVGTWLAKWQGKQRPQVRRPRIAVYAARHGHAGTLPAEHPVDVKKQVKLCLEGVHLLNTAASQTDTDLQVYELDLDSTTDSLVKGPAMSQNGCGQSIAYGMMAVENGIDVVALSDINEGDGLSAHALVTALTRMTAESTGLSRALRTQVQNAMDLHGHGDNDPINMLRCFGGFEIAAMCGTLIAARMARTPVLLDGIGAIAAATVLWAIKPSSIEHCRVVQPPASAFWKEVMKKTGLDHRPLMSMVIPRSQGIMAALSIPVLKTAAESLVG